MDKGITSVRPIIEGNNTFRHVGTYRSKFGFGHLWILAFFSLVILGSCKEEPKIVTPQQPTISAQLVIPKFERDSAYVFLENQLAFGFRVPGTPEHVACKDWLKAKLESYGATVYEQPFKVSFLSKKDVQAYNVIGAINPQAKKRIIIAAHWDSRLIAEKDPDPTRKKDPIMGADDGASGVAVALEIARILKANPIDLGVDIIFFDAEDQGGDQDGWCLGSKYWSSNFHVKPYTAKYGILLDMVGAKNAKFGFEQVSMRFAPDLMKKVWALARNMGYTDYFIESPTGEIMDDHYYVNVNARIPMIDIINRPLQTDHGFGHYHHTHEDNLEIIDKRTLEVVGKVVTAVIYKENHNSF